VPNLYVSIFKILKLHLKGIGLGLYERNLLFPIPSFLVAMVTGTVRLLMPSVEFNFFPERMALALGLSLVFGVSLICLMVNKSRDLIVEILRFGCKLLIEPNKNFRVRQVR